MRGGTRRRNAGARKPKTGCEPNKEVRGKAATDAKLRADQEERQKRAEDAHQRIDDDRRGQEAKAQGFVQGAAAGRADTAEIDRGPAPPTARQQGLVIAGVGVSVLLIGFSVATWNAFRPEPNRPQATVAQPLAVDANAQYPNRP
jgi:hypothetical protein